MINIIVALLLSGSPAPCAYEDGSGQPAPCFWDAGDRGNGKGQSFIEYRGKVMHISPSTARRLTNRAI